MGIDKSDIQSVIHYDLPRSIENYVQEIGRAGRNGQLARCHMFLNNEDFYTLRRITLSDLLDSQSCFRLTNKVISQAKREFLKLTQPDFAQKRENKKKLKAEVDDLEPESIIDVF
jgi:superfamily II DNA helicase RecQ